MRAVSTKIQNDVYEELLQRCTEDGHNSLASCLRALIYSYLGKPQTSMMVNIEVDLRELVSELQQMKRELADLRRRLDKREGLNKWLSGSNRQRKR
jgi:hypothetical protein